MQKTPLGKVEFSIVSPCCFGSYLTDRSETCSLHSMVCFGALALHGNQHYPFRTEQVATFWCLLPLLFLGFACSLFLLFVVSNCLSRRDFLSCNSRVWLSKKLFDNDFTISQCGTSGTRLLTPLLLTTAVLNFSSCRASVSLSLSFLQMISGSCGSTGNTLLLERRNPDSVCKRCKRWCRCVPLNKEKKLWQPVSRQE